MSERLMEDDRLFYRGFAAAIGCLAGDFGSPCLAAQLAHANGVTLKNLRNSGVMAFDLPKPLIRALRRNENV